MIFTEWTGVELKEARHSRARMVIKKWTDVDLNYTYHLEPGAEGIAFLCYDQPQQMARGRWIQQVAMTRDGRKYSRTDNVA
eukprot:7142058-Pyramimonas_sp.AAC.1